MASYYNYFYEEGQKVNSLIIKKRIRYRGQRGYVVQSITYPSAPEYKIVEWDLKNGIGDAYLSSRRVFEGNSLYSVERIRPYLVDIEQSKTIASKTTTTINARCPQCNRIKTIRVDHLVKGEFSCKYCSTGVSYPEKFLIAYLEVKGIKYEYQKVFKDLPNRRFDFYLPESNTVIETHGEQHYKDNTFLSKGLTKQSDEEKRKYCINNTITLIELDCRKSEFNFIKENINLNNLLPTINYKDSKDILELLFKYTNYNTDDIIYKYKEGCTTLEIAKEYNISKSTVSRILKKHNIKLRNSKFKQGHVSKTKKVKCLNTGKVFNSVKDAQNWCIKGSKVSYCARGLRETAGIHPDTGEKLKWEYIK